MALIQALGLSERRACRLIRQTRSTQSYSSVASDDRVLKERMKALANRHIRFGHPRLHTLLRRDGFGANHKKTHRIYTEEKLQFRQRKCGGALLSCVAHYWRRPARASVGAWILWRTSSQAGVGSGCSM